MPDENNGKVPIVVLDKFIGISEANNQAYSQIVGVLDELSSHILDMRNTVDTLSDQIRNEQLADVVQASISEIQKDVNKVSGIVEGLKSSYNNFWGGEVVKGLNDYLRFNNIDHSDFSKMLVSHLQSPLHSPDNRDLVFWVLDIARSFKRHWGKVLVGVGVSLAFIYLNGGESLVDIIAKLAK